MKSILAQIAKHKLGIVGTIAFHVLLISLLLVKEFPNMKLPFFEASEIEMDFSDPRQDALSQFENFTEEELQEMKSLRETLNFKQLMAAYDSRAGGSKANDKMQEEIDKELRAIEQEVIDQRRAEGKGPEEWEEEEEEKQQPKQQEVLPDLPSVVGKPAIDHTYKPKRDIEGIRMGPMYMCEGQGKVVVDVKINRSGKIISRAINKEASTTNNDCNFHYALQATKGASFTQDNNAPSSEAGRIIYTFRAQ